MTRHDLKVWPAYFEAIVDGTKSFEVRRNDRDFKVGDRLTLREFDPGLPGRVGFVNGAYTGRKVSRWVNFVYALPPECGYPDGVSRVVMSLGLSGRYEED